MDSRTTSEMFCDISPNSVDLSSTFIVVSLNNSDRSRTSSDNINFNFSILAGEGVCVGVGMMVSE